MFATATRTLPRLSLHARAARAATQVLLLATVASGASANVNIVFDYSYDTNNFFSDAARKSVLEAAALTFESRLTDSLTAITSGSGGTFNVNFLNPNNFSPVVPLSISNFSVAANEVRVFVGGGTLPGATLGVGGPGGFGVSGATQVFLGNAVSRGQAGALLATETDFGPWGGAISFNSATSWHFDTTPSSLDPMGGAFDFYSVAVHELAHVLGMGTADSWDSRVVGTNFVGTAAGTRALSVDKGHWAVGTMSTVGVTSQEAAMSPSISANQRKYFTTLDYAGMQDIGWQVSAVPEPATWLMWGVGGAAWLGLRRRAAKS